MADGESKNSERERGEYVIKFLEAELRDYKFGLTISVAPLAILLSKFETILKIDGMLLKMTLSISVICLFVAAIGATILISYVHDCIQRQNLNLANEKYKADFDNMQYSSNKISKFSSNMFFIGIIFGYIFAIIFIYANIWE